MLIILKINSDYTSVKEMLDLTVSDIGDWRKLACIVYNEITPNGVTYIFTNEDYIKEAVEYVYDGVEPIDELFWISNNNTIERKDLTYEGDTDLIKSRTIVFPSL